MKNMFKHVVLSMLLVISPGLIADDTSIDTNQEQLIPQKLLKDFMTIFERMHLSLTNNDDSDQAVLDEIKAIFFQEHAQLRHLDQDSLGMEFVQIFLLAGLKALLFSCADYASSSSTTSDIQKALPTVTSMSIIPTVLFALASRVGGSKPKLNAEHMLEGTELLKSIGSLVGVWLATHGLKLLMPAMLGEQEHIDTMITAIRWGSASILFLLLPLFKRDEHHQAQFDGDDELLVFVEELRDCGTKDDLEDLCEKYGVQTIKTKENASKGFVF